MAIRDYYVLGYFSEPDRTPLTSIEALATEKHLTIAPEFTMDDANEDALSGFVGRVLTEFGMRDDLGEAIAKSIGSETFDTEDGDVTVELMEKNREIMWLHRSNFYALKLFGAVPARPEYGGLGYKPHVSHAEAGFEGKITHVAISRTQSNPFVAELVEVFELKELVEIKLAKIKAREEQIAAEKKAAEDALNPEIVSETLVNDSVVSASSDLIAA